MVTPVNKCFPLSPSEPSSSPTPPNPSLVYFGLMDLLVLRDSFVHQGSPHIVTCLCGVETAPTGTSFIHQDGEGCLLTVLKACEEPEASREEGVGEKEGRLSDDWGGLFLFLL